jgi:complex iron-sulfur molybdoenzyme family reductase subunit gamma
LKKFLISSAVAAAFSAAAWSANIVAAKVNHSLDNIDAHSPLWSEAKFVDVELYPQTTVKMNDKKANELNKANRAKIAKVKALYNEETVAFLIIWKDETLSIQKGYKTTSFGDGFAVQFPVDYSNPKKLPYIGMGSEGREVVIHLQKAAPRIYEPNGNGNVALQVNRKNTNYFNEDLVKFDEAVAKAAVVDYERSFVSAGFRSMTEIKDKSVHDHLNMIYNLKKKLWIGTISRDIKDEYVDLDKIGAFPVAFAVWDGDKMNRDGLKLLSSWQSVTLSGEETKEGKALVDEVNREPQGDIAKGRSSFETNCAACHIAGDIQMSVPFMAPELTNIGGYSTTAYLEESIVDPNAVVVPGYNRNAHKNYPWYNLENGKRVSTMPSFSWMSKEELADLVTFLKSLKSEVEK